jgi:hypothetical protein
VPPPTRQRLSGVAPTPGGPTATRFSLAVIEAILAIRDTPPEHLHRTPGPRTILYYLPRAVEVRASRSPARPPAVTGFAGEAGTRHRELLHRSPALYRESRRHRGMHARSRWRMTNCVQWDHRMANGLFLLALTVQLLGGAS